MTDVRIVEMANKESKKDDKKGMKKPMKKGC